MKKSRKKEKKNSYKKGTQTNKQQKKPTCICKFNTLKYEKVKQ